MADLDAINKAYEKMENDGDRVLCTGPAADRPSARSSRRGKPAPAQPTARGLASHVTVEPEPDECVEVAAVGCGDGI